MGMTMEQSKKMMVLDPDGYKEAVNNSLRRHVAAVNSLADRGMYFWDYGNSFLLNASRAGAAVFKPNKREGSACATDFRYPSYVQDIMGDVFSLGFGPFRWVCTSADPADLALTDKIAASVIRRQMEQARNSDSEYDKLAMGCYADNLLWVENAGHNELVVGSQARILYSNAQGRQEIAIAMNEAYRCGQLSGPVVISRDHHDVSGADSPWRETSNVYDGSAFLADMAVHNAIGDSFRGATWVALHNGGGMCFFLVEFF